MNLRISIFLLLFFLTFVKSVLALDIYYDVGIVLNTTKNQTNIDVEVPEDIRDVNYTIRNRPNVIFFAIDRISSNFNDTVNFVSVCKNEGSEEGNNTCSLKVKNKLGTIYDNCENRIDLDEGISKGKGITICRGSFNTDLAEDIFLAPYASDGNVTNSLVLRIPNNEVNNGILTVFNSPNIDTENETDVIPFFHPLIVGNAALNDYSLEDWTLINLKGFKDSFNNSIDKYVLNTKSFLTGEGVLISPFLKNSNESLINKTITVSFVNSDGSMIKENDIVNPGFKNRLEGWSVTDGTWMVSSQKLWTDYSIHTSNLNSDEESFINQSIKVSPNKLYEISGWIKTENVISKEEGSGAAIWISVMDAEGNVITNSFLGDLNSTNNWSYVNKAINTTTGKFINIWLQLNKASGDAWFDDISFKELSDSNGRTDGKIFWLDNKSDYRVDFEDFNKTFEVKIEPDIKLTYSNENIENEIIVGNDVNITKQLSINLDGFFRPQILNITPNLTYPIIDCNIQTGEKCFDSLIIFPNSETTKIFNWRENGIEMKILMEKQNTNKRSTTEVQFLTKLLNFTNIHKDRTYSNIKAAIYVDGECDDWKENYYKLNWISERDRKKFCYAFLDELRPLESIIIGVNYSGDWININFGEMEQDMSKISTLNEQYLIKTANLTSIKKVSWKNILVNATLMGNCYDCLKNVSMKVPILSLDFNSSEVENIQNANLNETISHMNFNGINESTKISSDKLKFGGSITVESWIYSRFNSENLFIVSNWFDDKNGSFMFNNYYGDLKSFIFTDKGMFVKQEGSIPLNEWTHVAFVYDEENNTLINYLNGKEQGISVVTEGLRAPLKSDLFIAQLGNDKGWFNGSIKEIKIYERALESYEIFSDYNKSSLDDNIIILSFRSSGNWINYKIGEPEMLYLTNKSQIWNQRIILNNTINLTFYNLSVNLLFDNENHKTILLSDINSEKVYSNISLNFNMSNLEKNTSNFIYALNFSIPYKKNKIKTNNSNVSSSGMFIFGSSTLERDWLILFVIIIIIGFISIIYRTKVEKNEI